MTPGEKITVSHKEWAKTVEEFEKELTTITKEEMEKATTERTELTESTTKDEKTEHKFDTGLKVTGSGAGWSVEFTAGYDYNNLKTKHSEFSSKRNREITHKAASRSKEEHKFTFKISREVTREDEQVRVIENKSDEVVRWDFYRYLLRKYIELMDIQEQIDGGFVFDLTPEDIVGGKEDPALKGKDYVSPEKLDNYYLKLAGDYGVELPEPPKSDEKNIRRCS
ncbi:MAG: hypothetical protein ACXQT5_08210 [Candidatus Syntropharchaeia archaeon]